MTFIRRLAWMACIGLFITSDVVSAQDNYQQELLAWRDRRDMNLRGDNGWLTVAGLIFLKPGAASVPISGNVIPAAAKTSGSRPQAMPSLRLLTKPV